MIQGLSYNNQRPRMGVLPASLEKLPKEKSPDGYHRVSPESHKLRSSAWEINLCRSDSSTGWSPTFWLKHRLLILFCQEDSELLDLRGPWGCSDNVVLMFWCSYKPVTCREVHGEALTPLVSDLQIYKPKRVAYSIGYWLFHISSSAFFTPHTGGRTHACAQIHTRPSQFYNSYNIN